MYGAQFISAIEAGRRLKLPSKGVAWLRIGASEEGAAREQAKRAKPPGPFGQPRGGGDKYQSFHPFWMLDSQRQRNTPTQRDAKNVGSLGAKRPQQFIGIVCHHLDSIGLIRLIGAARSAIVKGDHLIALRQ